MRNKFGWKSHGFPLGRVGFEVPGKHPRAWRCQAGSCGCLAAQRTGLDQRDKVTRGGK